MSQVENKLQTLLEALEDCLWDGRFSSRLYDALDEARLQAMNEANEWGVNLVFFREPERCQYEDQLR